MELFAPPESKTYGEPLASAGLLYQPPSVSYEVPSPPPGYQQYQTYQPPQPQYGLGAPSFASGTMMPPQGPPPSQKIEIAKGYKWKESAPVIVYLSLVIAGLILIIFTPGSAKAKLLHMLIAVVWTLLFGFLIISVARRGKTALAWVLAITPIVIWLIFQILIFIKAVVINL